MSKRTDLIHNWIQEVLNYREYQLLPASEDASFRRYFRLTHENKSTIIMDAPPELEDCRPFMKIDQLLIEGGVHAPEILVSDPGLGIMQLEDLGDIQYLSVLNENNADKYYKEAINALISFQKESDPTGLTQYDEKKLQQEMDLFNDWLLKNHLGIHLNSNDQKQLEKTMSLLIENALSQPQTFVHRDYHSRNLMLCENNNPGIIDFQDAVFGPVSYDLVSLLKDCYIKWPRDKVLNWVKYYLEESGSNQNGEKFLTWFDLMGVQRHLKASGIFARLNQRDNKPGFMKDIPRTLSYISDLRELFPELGFICDLINDQVMPQLQSGASR